MIAPRVPAVDQFVVGSLRTLTRARLVLTGLLLAGLVLGGNRAWAVDPSVLAAQQRRVEILHKITPSVVAVFSPGGGGGGSGVVVTPDGYALSNFHVTSGAGHFMKCGLNDGKLYDAVIVGVDPAGDVALLKLLGRDDFPTATLGDSDRVQVGDWAYAIGNPFLLATDFQPTVTYGIVSGVRRYQPPAAGFMLEYTDCIQVDSSINPGNSGGPLFHDTGELIGINGRGSFEKRGRVNCGAGYAISINQIKHFWDHLRSGRIVDHATLGAVVRFDGDGAVVVTDILETSDAYRHGLRNYDEIVSFAGRVIGSPNQLKNVVGIYPRGQKLPLVYRREGQETEIWIRLSPLHRASELIQAVQGEKKAEQPGKPGPGQPPEDPHAEDAPPVSPELQKLYIEKTGFTNYYFNQLEQDRVWPHIADLGDYRPFTGAWRITGQVGQAKFSAVIAAQAVGLDQGDAAYLHEFGEDLADIRDEPPGTGGLLAAWYQFRLLLTKGREGFSEFYYLGSEPLDGRGELVDVLVSTKGEGQSWWFVRRSDGNLVGFDFQRAPDAARCEVRIPGWKTQSGVPFPTAFVVSFVGQPTQTFEVQNVAFTKAADKP